MYNRGGALVQQIINAIMNGIRQFLNALDGLVNLVVSFAYEPIKKAFALFWVFETLPIWKRVLLIVVALAVAGIIYMIASEIWISIRRIFESIMGLIRTIFDNIWYFFIAGVLAFGGAWAINNLTIAWLP